MDNQSQPVNDQPTPTSIPPIEPPKPANKHIAISVIAILLFLGATAGTAYFYLQTQSLKTELAQISPTPAADNSQPENLSPTPDPTADWQTYTNSPHHFTFKYPSTLSLKEGAGDNMPLVFLDIKPITIPEMWDNAQLTPLEVNLFKKSLEVERVAFTTMATPESITQKSLSSPLNGYLISGIIGPGIGQGKHFTVALIGTSNANQIIALNLDENRGISADTFTQILSTFHFTDSTGASTPQPTSTATTITYSIPSGWQTTTDPTNTFQVGFDPTTQTAAPNPDSADPQALWVTTKNTNNSPYYSPLASSTIFSLKPYNGGSRHTFLESIIFKEPLSLHNTGDSFIEKNYTVQGKSCLVLYGLIDMSGGHTTVGMCALSATQAISFSSFSNQTNTETLLGTLKFN